MLFAQTLHFIEKRVYCLDMRPNSRNRGRGLFAWLFDPIWQSDLNRRSESDLPPYRPERDHSTPHNRPQTPSVRVIGDEHDFSRSDQPAMYDQDNESESGLAISQPSRRPTQMRKATKAKQDVYVFADRKNEVVRLPTNLSKRGVLDVAISRVPCTAAQLDGDSGTWSFETQSQLVQVAGFYSAKTGDRSEDSEPLMVASSAAGKERIFIGVFDGMGGAGASVVERDNNFTEAYRASRIARLECFRYSAEKVVNGVLSLGRDEISGRELTTHLAKRMKDYAEKLGIGPGTSRIRGTLTKTLPTTLACADVSITHTSGQIRVEVRALWAGDSRVWIVTPQQGLQQLTRDDVDIEDPLEQLRQDPPMMNVVSASVDFTLNEVQNKLIGPCIVLAASDGFSGYVRSPGEVELLLLESFDVAERSGISVGNVLMERFTKIAQDDVSCVVAAIGFRSVSELNDAFAVRRKVLEDRYSVLNAEMTAEEFSETVDGIWATERPQYCEWLGGGKS